MGLRAWPGARAGAWCIGVSVALLATSGVAGAASPRVITGKLSRPDYTVIAVAAGGTASTVRAGRGSFRLRPRAGSVTLHLRGPDGVYAGPVVIRGSGRRAIVGVRAGARLGSIAVHASHARLARRLARRWVDARYVVRARKNVPIGAGRFGRVRGAPPRSPRSRVPGDLDRDGVPNPLDIDDDGDLTLDNLDRTPRGPVRARAAQEEVGEFPWEFNLHAGINETVNANATGITPEQVDAFLVSHSAFTVGRVPGDAAELDCAGSSQDPPRPVGLRYCSAGGTGSVQSRMPGQPPGPARAFPGPPRDECCFDLDGDGFGSIGSRGLFFFPRATTAEIRTGDVLIQHVAKGVAEDKCPSPRPACASYAVTLQYVPATSPALVAYSDGQGNCAKASGTAGTCATEFSYPGPPGPDPGGVCPPPGPPCFGPGTRGNPFPVKARATPCPDPALCKAGDVVVTVTFWRPQRARIGTDPLPLAAGDSETWTDIGRLGYGFGFGGGGQDCPPGSISEDNPGTPEVVEDDPSLEITPTHEPEPGIVVGGQPRDRATDKPANPNNTLTYTVNLTKCLAVPTDAGPGPEPWNPEETKQASLGAGDGSSAATLLDFFFRRQAE